MTASGAPRPLPSWADQMKALERVGDELCAAWRPDGVTEAERQDMYRLALSILSCGYLCRAYTNARRPEWMPLWNIAFNQGGPVPDYVYKTTEIDPNGVYRISGHRGTSRFVEITQQAVDMFSPELLKKRSGGAPASHDLDELRIGDDGTFGVILSAERPADHDGDWWPLDSRTVRLLMRNCCADWSREIDARVAIERLDDTGEDLSPEEFARRFSDMADWIVGMITFDMVLVRYYREHHGINTLLRSGLMDEMGPLPVQVYYDGIHEIDDDQALIIETELPKRCRYWQALVADDRFSTIDWVNRQSSLNDAQARIDGDGRFRAVISSGDPGVPNWLDKGNVRWGVIQMRWNKASDHPDPSIQKVRFSEVRKHLPADTPLVTPAERRAQLRTRRVSAQMRNLW
jgi:hypothetical protein